MHNVMYVLRLTYRYETLILVAGGSGIAPFISILKDLIHRHNIQTDDKIIVLPSNVTLVWAVRKADELQILNHMSFPKVPPSGLHLRIQGYVTRQQTADPEAIHDKQSCNAPASLRGGQNSHARLHPICPELAKDSNLGHFLVLTAAVVGLLLAWALFVYFITGQTYNEYKAWIRALWFMLAAALGAGLFGGGASLAWARWVQPQVYQPPRIVDKSTDNVAETEMRVFGSSPKWTSSLLEPAGTHYGFRPDIKGFERVVKILHDMWLYVDDSRLVRQSLRSLHKINGVPFAGDADLFHEVEKRLDGQCAHVGVLVCGPESMQQTVAAQCQAHSSLFGAAVAFHYHSVSFDL